MDFEVVGICFEVVDSLLPICRQDFTRGSGQSLIDLRRWLVLFQEFTEGWASSLHLTIIQNRAQCGVHNLALITVMPQN